MQADSSTEDAIYAVLQRFTDAVHARDADAVMGLFAADADVCLFGSEGGEKAIGRVAVGELFRWMTQQYKELRWEWTWRQVSAAGNVAWLAAEAIIHSRTEEERDRVPYRLTAVFERRDGGWCWMLYHGSEAVDVRAGGSA